MNAGLLVPAIEPFVAVSVWPGSAVNVVTLDVATPPENEIVPRPVGVPCVELNVPLRVAVPLNPAAGFPRPSNARTVTPNAVPAVCGDAIGSNWKPHEPEMPSVGGVPASGAKSLPGGPLKPFDCFACVDH